MTEVFMIFFLSDRAIVARERGGKPKPAHGPQ